MTPLVLLPGMMCDARLFGPQIEALSGRIPLLTAPLIGADRVAALAQNVLTYAPPRFALAGLSMGGIVAMEIVAQAPERVAGLALLDTNPLAEAADMRARRGPQLQAVAQGGLRAVMRDEMKPNYLADTPARAQILDLCMDMAMGLGPDVFISQSKALMTRPDQTETLRSYGRPALVLCGRQDALCPPARHEMMHGLLRKSRLVILDNAGHLPTLEATDQTTAALARWMEEI